MRHALLAALCLVPGWAAAGDVKEAPLEDPPPPTGMHKLSRSEVKAKTSAAAGAIAVFAVTRDEGLGEALDKDARRLEAHLSDALAARGAALVDLEQLFPTPPPEPLPKGEELFKQGRGAYDNLDTDGAAEKFNQAVSLYLKHPVDADPVALSRALIFLGATLAQNGDAPGARDAFQNALLIDPKAKPNSDLFGKDVQSAFEKAKSALEAREKGTLHVESVPPGARVSVTGKDQGATPVEEIFLPAGKHRLLVRRPGYLTFGAFPEVTARQTTEVEAVLEATGGLAAMQQAARKLVSGEGFAGKPFPPDAKAMGERLGARFLVLVSVSPAGAEMQVWDLTTGDRLKGVPVSGKDKAGAATAAESVLQWVEHPPGPSFSERVPGVMKKWWFWAGVGAAAAIVAGTAVAVSSNHPHCALPDCTL